ncbi:MULTISPECIES: hypothetical protein [unclassified Psychrobacter]|uniref:hypothetical protein n=1 Tax=unclassified Psychrobacter TaxID=196806 RepID=UPI0025FBEAB4|nr:MULTISPECIES: hypothetical protein [unclassified Psychrobacter]
MEVTKLVNDIKSDLQAVEIAGKTPALIRLHPLYHRTFKRFNPEGFKRHTSADEYSTFLGIPIQEDVKQKYFEIFVN